jgi:hypothetical protein
MEAFLVLFDGDCQEMVRIAKKWYTQTVKGVKRDWEVLQNVDA